MGGRVDAAGKAGGDDDARGAEVAGDVAREALAECACIARTDDGDDRPVEDGDVADCGE